MRIKHFARAKPSLYLLLFLGLKPGGCWICFLTFHRVVSLPGPVVSECSKQKVRDEASGESLPGCLQRAGPTGCHGMRRLLMPAGPPERYQDPRCSTPVREPAGGGLSSAERALPKGTSVEQARATEQQAARAGLSRERRRRHVRLQILPCSLRPLPLLPPGSPPSWEGEVILPGPSRRENPVQEHFT